MAPARGSLVALLGTAAAAAVAGALGWLDRDALLVLVLIPATLLGLHHRHSWSRAARAAFLVGLSGIVGVYFVSLAQLIVKRIRAAPEWDFLGFWLHARTAVLGQSFYNPRNAQALAAPLDVSSSFQREIVDVGFWYPPPSIFLFLPLGWFDRGTALVLWYGFLVVTAFAVVVLLRKIFFPIGGATELAVCALLLGASYGTRLTVYFSQTSVVALLALLLCWRFRDSAAGGAWSVVGFFVKPFLGVVAIPALLARRWRFVLGAALAALALLGATSVVFGLRSFPDYFSAGVAGAKPGWIYSQMTNQSLLGAILRAKDIECEEADCLRDSWFVGGAIVILAITALLSVKIARRQEEVALSLWLLASLLVYPATQVFYSVFLIPPLLLLWRDARSFPGGAPVVAALGGLLYALCTVSRGHATVIAYLVTWCLLAAIAAKGGSAERPNEGHLTRTILPADGAGGSR